MTNRKRIGVLTPSSNTSLEPLTSAMLSGLPDVTAHFSRFSVTEISLGAHALQQFDEDKILTAAKLLADAKVDVICWSGTSAGWLGFESDQRLCERIRDATGIPATTAVLALNEILQIRAVRTLGLVTPYVQDVNDKIVSNYAAIGVTCQEEPPLGLHVNFEFAEVPPEQLARLIRESAKRKPDAITTFCTNLRAAHLASMLERETGVPLYDTVSTVVWKALKLAGVDTSRVQGWGELFSVGGDQ